MTTMLRGAPLLMALLTVCQLGIANDGRHTDRLDAENVEASDNKGATSARFPGDEPFLRVPFELLANCPYVNVMINGKGPFPFVVDTGSIDSPLASETLAELGLRPEEGSRGVDLTFEGGLQVKTEGGDTVSMAGLWPLIKRRSYGVIGYDVLRQFVVEFDYEEKVVTFYDPSKYKYGGSGTILPAVMEMGYDPQIEGELRIAGSPPIRTRFTIDTGAGGTVVTTPLVKQHRLTERLTQKVPFPGSGVDGMQFDTLVARIAEIGLGRYSIEKPLIALSLDSNGAFTMESMGVNLGGSILQRFSFIVDYPHQRIILQPNSQFHEPFPADASGLVLKAQGEDFNTVLVTGVVPRSPADESGIQDGDVISAIDGASTDKYALWQIQDLFKTSGQERTVTLRKKDNNVVTVKIKLRALA
jgi:hypothetical protein